MDLGWLMADGWWWMGSHRCAEPFEFICGQCGGPAFGGVKINGEAIGIDRENAGTRENLLRSTGDGIARVKFDGKRDGWSREFEQGVKQRHKFAGEGQLAFFRLPA